MNKLTIQPETRRKKGKEWMVMAVCQCGTIKEYRVRYIIKGHTKSCGCINKRHGNIKHPLYKVWQSMKERCYNPNHNGYYRYGGRGISICKQWRDDFVKFFEWAFPLYNLGLELDRINNEGNYKKSNCRFVTSKVNNRNRDCITRLTYKGETKPITEWAEIYNIPISRLRYRVSKRWEPEKIFNTPSLKCLPKPIRQLTQSGNLIAEFRSIHELKGRLKLKNTRSIGAVLKGRRPLALGYKWEYSK